MHIERSSAWLEPKNIEKICDAYWTFRDIDGFSKVMSKEDVMENDSKLSLQSYISQLRPNDGYDVDDLIIRIIDGQNQINGSLNNLYQNLEDIGFNG